MNKPFCSPLADKSAPAAVVVTPAGSMAGGCAQIAYLMLVSPCGNWRIRCTNWPKYSPFGRPMWGVINARDERSL